MQAVYTCPRSSHMPFAEYEALLSGLCLNSTKLSGLWRSLISEALLQGWLSILQQLGKHICSHLGKHVSLA